MKIVINLISAIFLFSGITYSQCIVNDDFKVFPVYKPYNNSFSSPRDPWNWPSSMQDGQYVQFFMEDTTKVACIGQYSNSVRNGCFKCFYPNGNVRSLKEYNNGMLIVDSLFYLNGNIEFVSVYDGGRKEYTEWRYSTGNIKSKRTNTNYKGWYENDELKVEKNFIGRELHGIVILNWENGSLKYMGNWERGKQLGTCKYSKKEGAKYKEMEYKKLPRKIKAILKVENY